MSANRSNSVNTFVSVDAFAQRICCPTVWVAVTSVAGFSQTKTLTAGQVINRIKEHLGVPWRGGADGHL